MGPTRTVPPDQQTTPRTPPGMATGPADQPQASYPHVYLSDTAGLTGKLALRWDGQQWTHTEVALGLPLPDGHIWAPHPGHPDATRILSQARQQADAREAALEDRFAELNPEFGVLPSRTHPGQHRFAQDREWALVLGTRVHLAEAAENDLDRDQAQAVIRGRAERATRPLQRGEPQRTAGVER